MKRWKIWGLSALATFAALGCTVEGSQDSKEKGSQDPVEDKFSNERSLKDLRIGYVRLDSLTQLYSYHAELVSEFEKKAGKLEARLLASQQNLQAEYEVLQNAAPNLSPMELERAQLDFQQITQEYQALEMELTQELGLEEAKMNAIVKEHVDKAMVQMQQEQGLDLVLIYESNLLYGAPSLDLTVKLADLLNSMEHP
jgi:Skp family chaperone for outer membrane proteins